jgi:hypothetical protein
MADRPRPEIVVCGALAHRPDRGGHAWALLQWVLGLRRLGWSTLWVDRLDAAMVGPGGDRSRLELLAGLQRTLSRFDLERDVAVLGDGGEVVAGIDRAELLARTADAAALFDIMGFCSDDEVLAAAPCRVGLDLDPGFGQLWSAQGLADPFGHHDHVVTVGLNMGGSGCSVPDLGRSWISTLPPVVLEHWPDLGPGTGPVTSVGSWRGPTGPLEQDGRRLGLRVHAARALLELPQRSGVALRMAWEIDEADSADREALLAHGWDLVDPLTVTPTMQCYEQFIAASSAELCIAKELYSRTSAGWFSDRSAVYLASGRPVVATSTGVPDGLLPDAGFLVCDDLDSAAAALTAVTDELERHSRAARAFAEERLDSDAVISAVLGSVGL